MGGTARSAVAHRNAAQLDSRAFNVGTSVETSVNDLARTLLAAAGSATPVEYAPARLGELQRSCVAIDKIGEAFGWRPTVSLHEGLAETFAFFHARQGAAAR